MPLDSSPSRQKFVPSRSSRPRASSTTSLADPSSLVGHAWGANYPTLLRSGVELFDRASRGTPLYLKMGIWLALFFSVLATVAHAEVTWNQMGDDAGPARRAGRKLASSHVGDFTLVDISSTISTDGKFNRAAAASNGKIVFAPYKADGVGVFQLPCPKDHRVSNGACVACDPGTSRDLGDVPSNGDTECLTCCEESFARRGFAVGREFALRYGRELQ